MNKLNELLRLMRMERGLSQEQLSGLVNLTHQAISNYERDKTQPSLDIIIRIAKLLDFKLIINNGNIIVSDNKERKSDMDNLVISIDTEMLKEVNYYKGDSVYFNSLDERVLASIEDKANELELILLARGELSVYSLDNEDVVYKDEKAVEYLRNLYEEKGIEYINENIQYSFNNWWEVLIGNGEGFYDGVTVCLDKNNTEEQIISILMDVKKNL